VTGKLNILSLVNGNASGSMLTNSRASVCDSGLAAEAIHLKALEAISPLRFDCVASILLRH